MCEVPKESVAYASPFPFIAGAQHVAIRGHPFHVLSQKSLAPLEHSVVLILALIDGKITDVENNTFSGLPSLESLSLDSNRLTKVKETWFIGLKKLRMLTLSNNHIKQIEPGSFASLTRLLCLDLENNLLQAVDPAWLFGLKSIIIMNLGLNEIKSISPRSFQHIQLTWLDLTGTDLSCLDGAVFLEQSRLSQLHVSSGILSSVHDAKPHGMMWSLQRFFNAMRGSTALVVVVPRFLFCVSHNGVAPGFSLWWMFDSSDSLPHHRIVRPYACDISDRPLSMISIQTPVVVLATNHSLTDKLETNTLEQCRQVWEYNGGVALGLVRRSIFRLISLSTGNSSFEGVGMSFAQTQDTNTLTTTESGYSQTPTPHTNAKHDNAKNITCILLTKDEHTALFFTTSQNQRQTTATTHRTNTDHSRTNTDHSISLTHYTEHTGKDYTSSEMVGTSTLQETTEPGPGPEVPPATDHVLISVVVVSAVVGLVLSSLVVLVLKLCSTGTSEDEMDSDDAHVWTIPPGVTFPGLLRSASLPARSGKMASDDAVSCRSLPAVLHSIEPTYSQIPDDVALAHRPLPGLPHVYCEIPEGALPSVVRSASVPACTRESAADDSASCRSLPVVLFSIEPTYNQIPDHMAAAQRPLPALPSTAWEMPEHGAATQRPLPVSHHTYSEIPDDEESGPMPFYADAAQASLHVVTNRGQVRRAFRDVTTASNRHLSGRSIPAYGSAEQTNAQHNTLYRKTLDAQDIRARRNLRTGLVSHSTHQSLKTFVHVTDAILSRGQEVTEAHIAFLTHPQPGGHWPWEIPGGGSRITPRRVSLPTVTLPNTYWPWEIHGEGTRNTPRRASLPTVTLPNTYWPWEIPGEGTHITPRRASLPTVTLPNTYWPWEIPGEGTRNTPRRAPLSTVTLPNTYWPWEIPGEGTCNTPRRASLPTVTLPNTYWPWEIPGEGTPNTPRRASLPTVTLPNTYWPWEIPRGGNTSRRAPLPTVTLPNTYRPWEIPGEGTHNTQRRASLPTVTLPNTYWPWEIPGEGTRNTPRRASLPTVTLPNTYWPWEIHGEVTRNTSRRSALSIVTLPNTYWPWEIPGEGTRNTPRRAPLPAVTLPNTYWLWEIPGEGTRNTPRRASLPTVTLPNTYWPWEIPGEGTRNTPALLPTVTLPNTYWPWEIPGEGTQNTPRRASLLFSLTVSDT
ncbi:PREDICTED: uncharacterized protein LOC109486646 [Branchiostoma belcheri]|uniref:Uncharacterized protein LOC109486646 n=1 Tax=Branchiostoma belcheri TaxID=7741 RepID=A0A6P5ASK1_BRABE|nr:PREDICTED: uncharacterized protein LOC109486646 [Branchiostoma belcheri]